MKKIILTNKKSNLNEVVVITKTTTVQADNIQELMPVSQALQTAPETDDNLYTPALTDSDLTSPDASVRDCPMFFSLIASDQTQDQIRDYCLAHGIECDTDYNGDKSGFDFHCTIMWSGNTVKYDTSKFGIYPIDPPLQLKPTGFDVFGPNRNCLVLKLSPSNKRLMSMRQKTLDLGLEATYPNFSPHITFSYAFNNYPRLPTMKIPKFSLLFDKIEVAEGKITPSTDE